MHFASQISYLALVCLLLHPNNIGLKRVGIHWGTGFLLEPITNTHHKTIK